MLSYEALLEQFNWRNTTPRRLVVTTLLEASTPLTSADIFAIVHLQDASVNLTTVYRILTKLEEAGVLHAHANGGVTLCSLDSHSGHHVLLQCDSCGQVTECQSERICQEESLIAKKYGFTKLQHVTELIGTCAQCSH